MATPIHLSTQGYTSLASGRPVVGTPIRSLREFSHIITIADTPDAWSITLIDSLSATANRSERVDARRSVARQHDWNILVRQVARILAERLGPTYLDRFEKGAPELDSALLLSPFSRQRPTVSSFRPILQNPCESSASEGTRTPNPQIRRTIQDDPQSGD